MQRDNPDLGLYYDEEGNLLSASGYPQSYYARKPKNPAWYQFSDFVLWGIVGVLALLVIFSCGVTIWLQ